MITIHTKTINEFTAGCYDTVGITAKSKEQSRAVGVRNSTATLFVNGFARLRASLFGPSLAMPIVDGAPSLGNCQQVTLMDFDKRPDNREVIVQLIGESE